MIGLLTLALTVDRTEVVDLFKRLGGRIEHHARFTFGFFRLVWLFGKDHRGIVLENLALRQQLSIYKRKHKRPLFVDRDLSFWVTLSVLGKIGGEP